MKKLLLVILLVLFSLSFQKAFAQSTPSAEINNAQYTLPYTGILPDNPLYFLKALRDNVYGLLITDPIKKAEFDLLMADKRLGGAEALIVKNKNDLAITTLSKSGNYFYQAIGLAAAAKKQGTNVSGVVGTLITASLKHQQVIFRMIQESSKSAKGSLGAALNRAKDFQLSAEQLRSN
jgi:cytochrome c-type biogenesis protein CcmE